MTDMCHNPYFLYYRSYPIDNSINNRCHRSVYNHRAGDGEHLRADTENKPLCWCQLRTHHFVF